MKPLPDVEYLKATYAYDPETGFLSRGGVRVGSDNPDGYRRVCVRGRQSLEHHVIYALMTGEWPTEDIDHINGVADDNRWCNLRQVGTAVNTKNRKKNANNTTGWNGVWFQYGAYKAAIRANRAHHYLGTFRCPTAAGLAVIKKARELGFDPSHGLR